MKIERLTYYEFLMLPEADRIEYQSTCLVLEPIEVDCTKWKWGAVKYCQDTFVNDCTYAEILEIAQMEGKKLTAQSPAHVVINMFNSIKKSIEAITQLESESLAYQQSPKEMAASDAVGGFGKFGTLPQTLSLVGVVAGSLKEVDDYDWAWCHQVMVFKHTEGLYQKQLYKA